jgi:hypothetical protein
LILLEIPSTLNSAATLASYISKQGRHAEAETMFKEVLVVQKRVLGAEHPSTLYTASNLAFSLYKQGKHADAETMSKEVLVVQKRVLGEKHPNTHRTAQQQTNILVATQWVEALAVVGIGVIGYLTGYRTLSLAIISVLVRIVWPAKAMHFACAVVAIYLASHVEIF